MTDPEKMREEKKIREAFQKVWAAATNQPGDRSLMSIPPRPDEDADFIMHDAMDELFAKRLEVISLRSQLSAAMQQLGERAAEIKRLNESRKDWIYSKEALDLAERRGAERMLQCAAEHVDELNMDGNDIANSEIWAEWQKRREGGE